jgi:four helix bundle protein
MNDNVFNKRFKQLALAIIRFTKKFPNEQEYWTIKGQIINCSTSAAANYRATDRAKSNADFINKLKITEEELDETMFWLEFTVGVSEEWRTDVAPLYREANELLSIVVASLKTSRKKGKGKDKDKPDDADKKP